jgi:ADP-heptose:LPS heptosyltransferase
MRFLKALRYYLYAWLKWAFHSIGVVAIRPFLHKSGLAEFESNRSPKILYISLAYRGDLILNFPILNAIKEKYPNSRLTCWVRSFNQNSAKLCPAIDKIMVYDSFNNRPIQAIIETLVGTKHSVFIENLRGFDLFIDDSGYAFTSLAGYLARIPVRIGRNFQGLGFLNHFEMAYQQNTHLFVKRLKILKFLGINCSLEDFRKPYLFIGKEEIFQAQKANSILDTKYFTIQPFAGWEAKNWGLDNFCKVVSDFTLQSGLIPVFIGAQSEQAEIEKAINQYEINATNLAGTIDLSIAAAIIAGAALHFGADSVGSQFAMALDIKSLTIFGPANPRICANLGGQNFGIMKKGHCSPKPNKHLCCFDGGRSCRRMELAKKLTTDEVLSMLVRVWKNQEKDSLVELER